MLRTRLATAAVVALSAAAVVPAAASAHLTAFGSSLNHSPANAGSTCAENGVMGPALCTHVASFFPGTSGKAKSPVKGTIVKIRLRAEAPTKMTFRVVSVRHLGANHKSGQAKAANKSQTVSVHGPTQDQAENGIYPVEAFKVKLKVKKGQMIAVDTKSNTAEYCADGTPGQLLFSPNLKVGQNFRSAGGYDGCLALIRAVVKY
jgi:hypothetical protein